MKRGTLLNVDEKIKARLGILSSVAPIEREVWTRKVPHQLLEVSAGIVTEKRNLGRPKPGTTPRPAIMGARGP